MCYTSWFELHISQDEHFNSYHSATILLCQPVRVGNVGGVCLTRAIVALVGEENSLAGYVCFGFDLKLSV